jgi:hypothetical protein
MPSNAMQFDASSTDLNSRNAKFFSCGSGRYAVSHALLMLTKQFRLPSTRIGQQVNFFKKCM